MGGLSGRRPARGFAQARRTAPAPLRRGCPGEFRFDSGTALTPQRRPESFLPVLTRRESLWALRKFHLRGNIPRASLVPLFKHRPSAGLEVSCYVLETRFLHK